MRQLGRTAVVRPQVAIRWDGEAFSVLVDGEAVVVTDDEQEAHHQAMHVIECVNAGLTKARLIGYELSRVCAAAMRSGTHVA
jgi:hypothetical protein